MGSANLSTKRQRIAEPARTKAGTALSTLHHVIDLEWMREAYRLTRKDGASGVDGVTAAQYEANLEANLLALLERIKTGRYVAPPVRRVYIPKADGSERPLGIPTFEDKVAQRAIVMVAEGGPAAPARAQNGAMALNRCSLNRLVAPLKGRRAFCRCGPSAASRLATAARRERGAVGRPRLQPPAASDPLRPARDGGDAGARHFDQADRPHQVDEVVDLARSCR